MIFYNYTGLGHDLEKRVHEKYEAEKQRAIREAEQAVWEQAEHMKAAAVLKAKEESSVDLERVVKKINRQHEKALKVSQSVSPVFLVSATPLKRLNRIS